MGARLTFPMVSLPKGTLAIVTGSNTGIGYETAKYLAAMGAHVILACRSEQRAREAMDRMRKEVAEMKVENQPDAPQLPDSLDLEFMQLDLGSLQSTMDFITSFKATGQKLQILICNAGVMLNKLEMTSDGYETMFQVNYLGHFLMVAHLLPIMKESGEDCRIVFTSSAVHSFAGSFNLETTKGGDPNRFSGFRGYGKSKLYQLQHMMALTKVLKGSHVTITSIHPGMVSTEIARNIQGNCLMRCVGGCMNALGFIKNPLEGATTLIDAAVNPKWKGIMGIYLENCKEKRMSANARNPEHQKVLWDYSMECLRTLIPEDIRQHILLPSQDST